MTIHHKHVVQSHEDVLEEIAAAVDISESMFEEAKAHYESIGEWLERRGSTLSGYDPVISPQGSFLLGTVTRPLSDAEEYDVDLVCKLNANKEDFTQKSLKGGGGLRDPAVRQGPQHGEPTW